MAKFNGLSILVTGGAGFVGSNLVRALLDEGAAAIHVVDNFLSAEPDSLPETERVRVSAASITDDALLASLSDGYDYLFHLSTYHGNQSSIHDPLADHQHNTLTTLKLYDRIKGFGRLRRVVYASAGCTVAEKTFEAAQASTEEAPVSLYLDSPYQISKIIGELYGNFYFQHHGLPVVKARFQNVYGPGEVLGAGRWRGTPATIWRNVTPTFIYRALKGLPLIVDNEGIATRDFIYVADIVQGLMACALRGEPGGVYNLASGVEISIRQLAETVTGLTKNPAPIQFGPKRPWDNSGKRFGSTEKSERALGFRAGTGLEEGLRETVAWTRDNLERIDRSILKHRDHFSAELATLFGQPETAGSRN